jgi:site-specific DNA recombinase
MEGFIAELKGQDGLITDFDERLWHSLLDFATVYSETDVRFTFRNGKRQKV